MSGNLPKSKRESSKTPNFDLVTEVLSDILERVQNDPESVTVGEVIAANKYALSVLEPLHKSIKRILDETRGVLEPDHFIDD